MNTNMLLVGMWGENHGRLDSELSFELDSSLVVLRACTHCQQLSVSTWCTKRCKATLS